MSELTSEQLRRIRQVALQDIPAPDGPYLEQFNALALADALDQECARAFAHGLPKISLHMDTDDAALLAAALRK